MVAETFVLGAREEYTRSMKRIIIGIIALVLIVAGGFIFFSRSAEAPSETTVSEEASLADSNPTSMNTPQTNLTLMSPVFADGASIPTIYTCDGDNINPPLSISGIPEDTESFVLIMDDPDIPQEVKDARNIEVFDHWVVFNIPPDVTMVNEGQEPSGVLGRNSTGNTGYTGPCPPDGEHRYFFKLYALDTTLANGERATKQDIETAMQGHILTSTELIGLYSRNQ